MGNSNPPIVIPVARPDISGNEEKYVVEAMRSSWISSIGGYIDRFERDFAGMCGAESSLAVANGTVALHLALLAFEIGLGDEVVVPSMTFVATANAVRYVGAEPVFVDVDPANWCIDPRLIEAAISPRTKAIVAVHAYGHPADMDAINEIARKHGLAVIEDAAEAHFATCRGRTVGSLGDAATFSFYGNKIFTSGEGGALTLGDTALDKYARLLRDQGMDPHRRYYFPITGYNFRLTNIGAAFFVPNSNEKTKSWPSVAAFMRSTMSFSTEWTVSDCSRCPRGPAWRLGFIASPSMKKSLESAGMK